MGDNNATFQVETSSSLDTFDWFYLEIWYPEEDSFTVALTPQNSACGQLPSIGTGEWNAWTCNDGNGGLWFVANENFTNSTIFPDGEPFPLADGNMVVIYAQDVDGDQDGNIDNQLADGSYTISLTNGNTNWDVYLTRSARTSSGPITGFYFDDFEYTNEGTITEPGNAEGVITVGSMNSKHHWENPNGDWFPDDYNDSYDGFFASNGYPLNEISFFSSLGPTRDGRDKPELYAPGAYIASSSAHSYVQYLYGIDGEHLHYAGTSMAAPHVAGAAALLLQQNPGWTPQQVKNRLINTSDIHGTFGFPMLDIWAALCQDNNDCSQPPGSFTYYDNKILNDEAENKSGMKFGLLIYLSITSSVIGFFLFRHFRHK